MRFFPVMSRCAIIFVFSLLFFSPRAYALLPIEQVSETMEEIRAIVLDPRLKGDEAKEIRRARIRAAFLKRFDFEDMGRRSLGREWEYHPDRRDEFVRLFIGFLERTYINIVESFEDEVVLFTKEAVDGPYAEVRSVVKLQKGGLEISVIYKLRARGGDWMVYDLVVENVSLVNNYRAQFTRIIAREGFEGLIRHLREKSG